MDKYIYCKDDFERAMGDALKEMFGHELVNFIVEKTIQDLDAYVNLYRFYSRNCPGCVCGNADCDLAYGRGKAHGCWKKALNGEIFDCPVRVNGTMSFSKEEGMKSIDISDREKTPYPVIKKEEKDG